MPAKYRQHLLAYLYFLLLVIGMTWPLVTILGSEFIGDPFSDAYEYARHIWWMNHAMRIGEPIFTQPLLGYPDGLEGAWLWGNPLQSFPAWLFLFMMSLPAAFNLGALLHLSLNGWAAYLLGWRLTSHRPAAILTGTVFALYPTLQGHLIAAHTGLLVLWGVPLYVLALVNLRHSQRPIWAIPGTAVAFVVSILGNNLLLIYALFPITTVFTLQALNDRQWRTFWRIIISVMCGGLIALIFVIPVTLEQLQSSITPQGTAVGFSADLFAILLPSFYNPVFSDLFISREVLGETRNVEGSAYIGIVAALLMFIALRHVRSARIWGWLALIAWVFSLGPLLKVVNRVVVVELSGYASYIVMPWALLMNFPILNNSRTTGRFNFVLALAIAVLVGYGLVQLLQQAESQNKLRRAVTYGVTGLLIVFIFFEYQVMWENGRPHLQTIPYPTPEPIVALRDDPTVEAVFNIPYDHLLAAKSAMILQTTHHKPLIAGHVTRQTPINPAKLDILQNTLDPALLDEAGADVVILHRQWDDESGPGPVEENTLERLGEPFFTDDQFMAWRVPEPTSDLDFAAISETNAIFTESLDSYTYAPANGWATLSGTTDTTLDLSLDGSSLQQVSDTFSVQVPLEDGYHTLTLTLNETCPRSPSPTLICPTASISDLTLDRWTPSERRSIEFESDIDLNDYTLSSDGLTLWWTLPATLPDNVIRFVHLLDSDGTPTLQLDGKPAASLENFTFDALSPGSYSVYLGWYTLPDVVRLPILTPDIDGAADRWVLLGVIDIR
jgi:hypothetical protein